MFFCIALRVYNWEYNESESKEHSYLNLILFVSGAVSALLLFLIFRPQIAQINQESSILMNLMFIPVIIIGFLYGKRITERAIKPSETRSPLKRSMIKIFLFFFVIGGMFSSVSFATNGGTLMPQSSILEDGLLVWASDFIKSNGGATFLILTSIGLMASATKRLVGLDGTINRMVNFIGTFIFFSMLALSFTHSDPSLSQIYLYTFYQAGIIGGALFEMNRQTTNLNVWEDYKNGYL